MTHPSKTISKSLLEASPTQVTGEKCEMRLTDDKKSLGNIIMNPKNTITLANVKKEFGFNSGTHYKTMPVSYTHLRAHET